MRSVHGYLSRRAQVAWPGALVTHDEQEANWQLERDGQETIGLGQRFLDAKDALQAMQRAEENRK